MTDGNISMEEDTELRDLVVQTLENNGVLAKVRAELRASVFLALEEQESVMNPEPLLNKTVKQYLANSEGKLLFSLVREFLEYFGLECTISVYDPETYFGKEYSYSGRNKLCEELGITSSEPLLGEILKSSMNGALNKNTLDSSRLHDTLTTNLANTTYDILIPKISQAISVQSSVDNDTTQNVESDLEVVTTTNATGQQQDDADKDVTLLTCSVVDGGGPGKKTRLNPQEVPLSMPEDDLEKSGQNVFTTKDDTIIFDDYEQIDRNGDRDTSKLNDRNKLETRIVNNVDNKRQSNLAGRTIYFEEIIVDGKKQCVDEIRKSQPFLADISDGLDGKMSNGIFDDFPPLNGRRTVEQSDLKELLHVGLVANDVDNYEDDFASSASGSTNEPSPSKATIENMESSSRQVCAELLKKIGSVGDEDVSEEIEETEETDGGSTCVSVNIAITE